MRLVKDFVGGQLGDWFCWPTVVGIGGVGAGLGFVMVFVISGNLGPIGDRKEERMAAGEDAAFWKN